MQQKPIFFKVIIDNMMNLEVLFHSQALTGNSTLGKIAVAHADTTMLNHIRPDGTYFTILSSKVVHTYFILRFNMACCRI